MLKTIVQKPMFQKNKWLILIIIFFIIWKFFLIHTMWDKHSIAPEPDDSFIYIAHISSVTQCPSLLFCKTPYSLKSFKGYEHLSYRLFFGIIGKSFHWTASSTYHYSFYIGILLLILSLLYFAKKITNNSTLTILILLFLTLYNGAGSYHGFFWVVPSFFSVLLFFVMLGIIFSNNKHWRYTLPLLSLTASLNHMISIYASIIFVFYYILDIITHKKLNQTLLQKTILIIVFTWIPYIYIHIILKIVPYSIQNLTQPATLLPGFNLFVSEYIKWILPNILGVVLFVIILSSIIHYKKYKILNLYISTIIFSILSMRSIHGVRALVYLWPITFIVYAYGTYYIFKFISNNNQKFKKILQSLAVVCIILFIALNLSYSYLLNKEQGQQDNLIIPASFSHFLKQHRTPKPYCSTTAISSYPIDDEFPKDHCNHDISKSSYLMTYKKNNGPTLLQRTFAKITNKNIPKTTTETYDKIPDNFLLKEKIGDILIYKRQ